MDILLGYAKTRSAIRFCKFKFSKMDNKISYIKYNDIWVYRLIPKKPKYIYKE